MRIAICDDMQEDCIVLKNIITTLRNEDEIECFSNGRALIDAIRSGREYSCLFIDIYLPDFKGTELVSYIQENFPATTMNFVFTTMSRDFAVDAFALNAIHYIIKPATPDQVVQVFDRIYDSLYKRKGIVIQTKTASRFVFFSEIATFESRGHEMMINLVNGDSFSFYQTIRELMEKLDNTFLPISRGIIVNANYIKEMRTKSCILKNNREILISRKRLKEIHDMYNDYIFSRLMAGSPQGESDSAKAYI